SRSPAARAASGAGPATWQAAAAERSPRARVRRSSPHRSGRGGPASASPDGFARRADRMAHDDHANVAAGTPALVVTVSDGVAAGTREDDAGRALADRLAGLGFSVERGAVPDERAEIMGALRTGVDGHALVVTTGGTGLTPRDVTPQATLAVIDYEVPGLAEAIRAAGRAKTPMADLSRGVVGVLEHALIVNVPGSPRAALESI